MSNVMTVADDSSNGGARHRQVGDNSSDGGSGDEPQIEMEAVHMKRNLGLVSGVCIIVGTIVGSGIFISPKGVLNETGSVGLSLVVWGGGGLLSLMGALSYAELGTLIRTSGAEYVYFKASMGPLVAYMFAWTKTIVLVPSTMAIICLTFASYVNTFFEACGTPQVPVKLVAALAIVTLGVINCWSTNLAAKVQVFFTVAKLIALGIIVFGGMVKMGQGNLATLQTGFEGSTDSPSKIALAFYDAMWAYDGWNNLNYVTEELKNPKRNLPLANIFGVLFVTVIYLFANASYLTVLTADDLLNSEAVATTWGERVLGAAYIIMPISVLFSTFGAANGSIFSGGRVVYAAGREGHLPEVLSYVHCKRYTPIISLIFTIILSLIMIIPADIGELIDFFSFSSWLFYALTMVALLILRYTKRDEPRPFKVPIIIPILFLIWATYLVIAPIVMDPKIEFLYAFLFMVGGFLFYFPLVYFKLDRGCFDPVTLFLQLFIEVAPSTYVPETE